MRFVPVAIFACVAVSALAPPVSASAATENVLYSFCSVDPPGCTDGEYPYGGVLSVKGELYTTTSVGGGDGTLNSVDRKTGAATVLYAFGQYFDDAYIPEAAPIEVDGVLYGTTVEGGSGNNENGAGTIYSWSLKSGKEKVAYSFCSEQNCADGAVPVAALLNVNGVLYGTTHGGGAYGRGAVFSFDPKARAEKVLYSFCASQPCADGEEPVAGLIEVNGLLYGTAPYGGTSSACSDTGSGCGVVFALDPQTGAETVLHTFAGAATDGGTPSSGLIDVNGTLYGTTQYGGGDSACPNGEFDGCGTVFSVDPATGDEKIVYAFKNDDKDGQNPIAGLVEMKGRLYGATEWGGGAAQGGTVFSLDPKTGKEKIVYTFCSQTRCNDGANPYAGLIALKGVLYGTTEGGGTGDQGYAIGGGTVFSITP